MLELIYELFLGSGLSSLVWPVCDDLQVDNTNRSTMSVTPSHILQALVGTEALNPGLVVGDNLAYMQCSDGGRINITSSTQVIQLYMHASGCQPGKQHILLRTAHGVPKPSSVECTICSCEGDQYRGQGLKPSDAELDFISTLKVTELDEQTIWQVAAGWWKGRKALVDAYIYTSNLYLQVDGTKHTGTFRGKKPVATIETDIQCCVDAWCQSVKLMRMHHEDALDSGCLLDALEWVKGQCCIVLSPGFSTIRWKKPDGNMQTYLRCLQDRLPNCEMRESTYGNYVFTCQEQDSNTTDG